MPSKILIVEDEELYSDQLEMIIEQLGYTHINTVDNSNEAMISIKEDVPDLILMDIHIQGEHDGIELADMIKKEHSIPIIFITSLQDDLTFTRASRTMPVQFLVKPFNNLQIKRSIELSIKQHNQHKQSLTSRDRIEAGEIKGIDEVNALNSHFFIKTRHKLEKVAVDEVLFLEADGHYCKVQTSQKKYLVRIAMTELVKRLPSDFFIKIHRSFIVNIKKIKSVDLQDSVVILEEKHLPLSKRNREVVLKRLDII